MAVQISALPTPPTRQDPTNFNDRADAFLSALPTFQTEANALSVEVNNRADNVQASDLAVMAATNITKWVSGTTYAQGAVVWSPINGLGYRRITASGSGTTDPSSDSTNYRQVNGTGNVSTDINGNLGLGVTPSAWGSVSSQKALQISSVTSVAGDAATARVINNSYIDGSSVDRYVTSQHASAYAQNAGRHLWYTAPSGTAGNPISFTQAMTLDASGNLLVGATGRAAGERLTIQGSVGSAVYSLVTDGMTQYFAGSDGNTSTVFSGSRTNHAYLFYTNGTERARIDSSGNLLVGATSAGASNTNGFTVQPLSSNGARLTVNHANGVVSGNQYVQFGYNGSEIGSIVQSGTTAVSYNTSSDYRLKHDIAPMQNALQRVAALKPCTYKWNADNSDGEGFIAHELAEVCPSAVTGEKDAVDADGNPVYQGIDTSFLVATLTAAIQEQQKMIDELRGRIEVLESK